MKRAMLRWWTSQMALTTPHDSTASTALASVSIVPAELNLDTVHNMVRKVMPVNARNTMQNITRTVNGVHPGIRGQGQIADSMWAWIKHQPNGANGKGAGRRVGPRRLSLVVASGNRRPQALAAPAAAPIAQFFLKDPFLAIQKSRYLLVWVNYESEAAEAAAAITILSRHGPRDICRRSLTE
jgi:hypothetical protein